MYKFLIVTNHGYYLAQDVAVAATAASAVNVVRAVDNPPHLAPVVGARPFPEVTFYGSFEVFRLP